MDATTRTDNLPRLGDVLTTSTRRSVTQTGTCADMLGWDRSFDCEPDAVLVNLGADTTRSPGRPLWCEVMGTTPAGWDVTLRPLDSTDTFVARNSTRQSGK